MRAAASSFGTATWQGRRRHRNRARGKRRHHRSCWRRISSRTLDVRWFGARADTFDRSDVAIQNAINAAKQFATTAGAEVHIPRGQYLIQSTLIIPRLGWGFGLTIRGDGPGVTILQGQNLDDGGGNMLGENQPVMAFEGTNSVSQYFRLEGMSLTRTRTPKKKGGPSSPPYRPTRTGFFTPSFETSCSTRRTIPRRRLIRRCRHSTSCTVMIPNSKTSFVRW